MPTHGEYIMETQGVQFSEVEDNKWDDGCLGKEAAFARSIPNEIQQEIDNSLGLSPITLRLQKSLVEDLKRLAAQDGLGYQPFVRQILTQYVRDQNRIKASV